ncbi:MAG: FlgD immunoglobulin-like domain containing protein, partial [Candidatus Eisenbacteria bacterium]
WRGALWMDPDVGPSSLVNFASQSSALATGGCRDLDISPDGKVWFALQGFGGSRGGVVRHTPGTSDWHYWTGGNPPEGGNGWPLLVWVVDHIAVQPKPAGGYSVWASGSSGGVVVLDSDTQVWTHQEFSFTVGSILELPGKESVDDAGNLWARRFAGFVNNAATYSLDMRQPDGTWISPPSQPVLPAVNPPIWAFRAFGDGQALLVDGNSRVHRFDGTNWLDYGIWREGAYSNDIDIDEIGNVWVVGTGGAAKRDAETGIWQRHRVSNSSQYDFFSNDLSVDPSTGDVYVCANAGPGVGGMTMFDGMRWTGYNDVEYGLGHPWPFPTDNSEVVVFRPSTGSFVVNPMFNGLHEWTGSGWTNLDGMSRSVDMVEDSFGRVWSLGEYFSLYYHDGTGWTSVPNNGTWGVNMQRDPDRAGTVWVSTYFEVIRTDGDYRYSRNSNSFPQLNPQSDILSTVAAGPDGTAWMGSTKGMFHLDAETGTYTYHTSLGGISCMGGSPLAVTPDGRVWWAMFDPHGTGPHGLAWFDGSESGIYSTPRLGEFQWGGLPHAQIEALEVREIPGGYELWMSCASRGIAVLTVPSNDPASAPPIGTQSQVATYITTLPNPTTGPTTLRLELASTGNIEVTIHDVTGRLLRSLANESLTAGLHDLLWDGLDANGREVGSGVYFVRVGSPDGHVAKRMMVTR